MTAERIKQIQQETAYPESVSVQQALLKVWNECEQDTTALREQVSKLREVLVRIKNDEINFAELEQLLTETQQ